MRAVLYCGLPELGQGLTMEEAKASIKNFFGPSEWAGHCIERVFSILTLQEGKEEERLALSLKVKKGTGGEPQVL